jgi:hypothetical protein
MTRYLSTETDTMRLKICGLLAIAATACCGTAQAQTVQFAFGVGGVLTNTFLIPNIGGTVDVTLYMLDNGGTMAGYTPNPGQPLNTTLTGNLRANGLIGFGVRMTSSQPTIATFVGASGTPITPFDPTQPGLPPDFIDQHFGFNFVTTRASSAVGGVATLAAQRLGSGDITPPVPPSYVGQVPVTDATPAAPAGRVELGTFRLTGLVIGTSNLTLTDSDVNNGNTAFGTVNNPGNNGGLVLDPVGGTSFLFGQVFTLNVVVPEPSSMILGGIALAGMGGLKFRRKKVKTEETAAV